MSGRRNVLFLAPLLIALGLAMSSAGVSAFARPADTRPRADDDEGLVREDGEGAADEADDDADARGPATRRAARGRDMREDDDDDEADFEDEADERGDLFRDRETRRIRGVGGGGDDWFRLRDRGESRHNFGYTEFPGEQLRDVVVANTQAAVARAMFRRAESALSNAVRKTRRTFEESDQLREAQTAEREAYQNYVQTRQEALRSVTEDPQYQALVGLRDELAGQIAARRRIRELERADARAYMEEILPMATLKMGYSNQIREMERAATADHEALQEARERLMASARQVSSLRSGFEKQLRDDKDLAAARERLEDARVAKIATATYLKTALIAAEEALDFAYYLNRYDGSSPYDNYRYDYPYRFPYRYAIGG